MEREEFPAVIKYFYLKEWTAAQIKAELDAVHGKSAPSLHTVYSWINKFKRGRTTIVVDKARPGHPFEVTPLDMVERIYHMVVADRRIKVREISQAVGISTEHVYKILHEKLEVREVCTRWVPRLLTPYQKRERRDVSKQCCARFNQNPAEFLLRFVTVAKAPIHWYPPDPIKQSKPGGNAPKKAKTVLLPGKLMVTVFWNSHGIILIDYLEKGKTITETYYATLLNRLKTRRQKKRIGITLKKVLFHQDNAPAQTSPIAMAKIKELGFELIPHPPYSPDLAPSDFFLFHNLQTWLDGKRFLFNEEVINAINTYFATQETSYFSEGIKQLESRWNKCIDLDGDYFEN